MEVVGRSLHSLGWRQGSMFRCAFDGLDAAVVVPGRIRAVTRAQLTLEVLENTYSADLSKLTYGWKGLSGPPRR